MVSLELSDKGLEFLCVQTIKNTLGKKGYFIERQTGEKSQVAFK